MKVLLIDDEPLARLELRRLLKPFDWIEAHLPGLVFLDIQMPGGTGFDLLERLEHLPRIIFTTAYDRYAVKAFDVNALDYLLKPVEPERLAAALGKIRDLKPVDTRPEDWLEQLFVRDGPRCWFMPLAEVHLLEAEGNYVRMYWGKERPLVGRSLVALEEKLNPQRFFRANRQHIINLDFGEGIEPGPSGALMVRLPGGSKIRISRRQSRIFRSRMGICGR